MDNGETFYTVIGIIYVFVLITTAVFSALTMLIFMCNWKAHYRSTTNLLIINSTIAFLTFSLAFSSQITYLFHPNEHETNNILTTSCRIRGYVCLIACVVKTSAYLSQAFSRYFITVLNQHRRLLTFRTHIIMIIMNWLYSMILSSLMLISPIAFQYEVESRFCILTGKIFDTSFTLMCLAFVVPVWIIILLYGLIVWHMTCIDRTRLNAASIKNNKRNVKVFQNILVLILIVVVGGTPYLSLIILNCILTVPWPLYSISILCIAFSACIESVTIFFTNEDIRKILSAKMTYWQRYHIRTAIVPSERTMPNTTTARILPRLS